MKVLTGTQMKALDQKAIEEHGIPSLVLMENAGRNIAEVMADEIEDLAEAQILVVSGKGNNGGDGLCAARHLIHMGVLVEVFIIGARDEISAESEVQAKFLEEMGEEIHYLDSEDALEELETSLVYSDIVLDAILGIGVSGAPRGLYKSAIEAVNKSQALVIAADVPSGVNADTGHVTSETAIQADLTITIEFPKVGLLLYPGSEYAGDVISTPIGYPEQLADEIEAEALLIEEPFVHAVMPMRQPHSHKGTYGKLLLIAGSTGMSGAAMMAGEAALRSGLGLLYMGYPQSLSQVIESNIWEAVKIPLTEEDGALSEASALRIKNTIESLKIDALAMGPGLSQRLPITKLVQDLLGTIEIPVLIDADGINALANPDGLKLLKSLKTSAILTPHPGEFAKLSGNSVEDIEADRIDSAKSFASKHGVVLVLKGTPTVIGLPDGTAFVNTTGNSGLATGGSGDVLTGIIGGLLAQGLEAQFAAAAGVYIHGALADALLDETGERAMLPRDLLSAMPDFMKEFE